MLVYRTACMRCLLAIASNSMLAWLHPLDRTLACSPCFACFLARSPRLAARACSLARSLACLLACLQAVAMLTVDNGLLHTYASYFAFPVFLQLFPGRQGIVRCKQCRTYINPYVGWMSNGRQWRCNVCGMINDVPASYQCHLGQDGQRTDRAERPELSQASVELVRRGGGGAGAGTHAMHGCSRMAMGGDRGERPNRR